MASTQQLVKISRMTRIRDVAPLTANEAVAVLRILGRGEAIRVIRADGRVTIFSPASRRT